MTGCRASCLHRASVEAYRAERDAQQLRAEAVTHGYRTELAAYFGTDGAGDAVEELWTFRRWLEWTAQPHD
jgi:hypothetical protein